MSTFYATFGQRYHHEPHPTLGDIPALPDAMWPFEAEDIDAARAWLFAHLGQSWSDVYDASDAADSAQYYPFGIAQAGLQCLLQARADR